MIEGLALWIAQLTPDKFWLYFFLASGGSLLSFYLFFRYLWRYRIMQDTPTALIRSAAQGYNEFEGVVELLPGESIIAPLTKLPCVWFSYRVEERQSYHTRHGTRTTWVVRETGVSEGLFSLVGKTGSAIVDPDEAEVTHSKRDVWYGSSPSPSIGPTGFTSGSWVFGRRYRYSEQRIHGGDPVYILGNFSTLSWPEAPSLAEEVSAVLKRWKAFPEAILRRFDVDKDGQVDEQEWASAVLSAKRQAADNLSAPNAHATGNLISKTSDSRKPYLISAQGQSALIRRFQRQSWVALSLFFILGLAAVWMANIRLM